MENQTEPSLWQFSQSKVKSSLGFTQFTIHMCGSPINKLFWYPLIQLNSERKYVMVKEDTNSTTSVNENSLWSIELRFGTKLYEIKETITYKMYNFYAAQVYDEKNNAVAFVWTGNLTSDWYNDNGDDKKRLWKITPIKKAENAI